MTIVQQPDSLSFCGNLKDFIITGESELSFSLYSGSTILIAENLYRLQQQKFIKMVTPFCFLYHSLL